MPFAISELHSGAPFGFVLSKENLLMSNYNQVEEIFTQVDYPDEYPQAEVKPGGRYLNIVLPNKYPSNEINTALAQFVEYLSINKLSSCGGLHIITLYSNPYNSHAECFTKLSIHLS